MIRTTEKVNEIHALARKRARMDLEGMTFESRAEYRKAEAEITGQILDGIIEGLNEIVYGILS